MAGRNNARYRAEVEWVRKRESQHRHAELWNTQCKYYDNMTRSNERFKNWTSDEAYTESLAKYNKLKEERLNAEKEEEARNKRDLELFAQRQREEIAQKEQKRSQRRHFNTKTDDIPTEILRDVNFNLKAKEEARRRREAELKLYQHWKLNNPLIRDCNVQQRAVNCKLAWLDAQVEKQMAKEKEEQDMKQLLAERNRRMKEEKEREKEYQAMLDEKNKQVNEIIQKQMEELKQKDVLSELLRREEAAEQRRKDFLEEINRERVADRNRRMQQDNCLFNMNQIRLKLRRRGKMVAEEIESEKRVFERILHSQQLEDVNATMKAHSLREALEGALECLREQEAIERKRQEYLSFIFDSEAKLMWQKQEFIWQMEQRARDDLFNDVMETLRKQIDEKIEEKVERQRELVREKESMLAEIERTNQAMQMEQAELQKKVQDRRHELDAIVNDKEVRRKVLADIERQEHEREIEKAKEEEEKLRREIANIQLKVNANPHYFPRRRCLW